MRREAEGVAPVPGDPWASREFYVKWARFSYLHCSWDTRETLSQLKGYKRVLNYMRKADEREVGGACCRAFPYFGAVLPQLLVQGVQVCLNFICRTEELEAVWYLPPSFSLRCGSYGSYGMTHLLVLIAHRCAGQPRLLVS